MREIKTKIERLYYILCIVLTEPFNYFYRKHIADKIEKDWYSDSKNYISFKEQATGKVIKSALKTAYYKNLQRNGLLPANPQLINFPIITKNDIKRSPDAFLNKDFLIPHTKKNTGGSTGQPFDFYLSLSNRQLEFAHQKFFYKRYGYSINDTIFSLDGIRISDKFKSKNIFWRKRWVNFPFGSLRLAAIDLNQDNTTYYIEKILQAKPPFIRGYPSAISMIAETVIKNKFEHQFNFIKGIMLTSENIELKQIELAHKAFNCPILPQYGMTESCAFAFTDKNKLTYYCSPFYGLTEILNSNGDPVKKGEIGEIILTSFGNLYQPFIRYTTGDLAQYGGEKNGFTILSKIVGRSQDYIVDSHQRKILLVGLIFGAHSSIFESIRTWQIIQKIPGKIEIRICPEENWSKKHEVEISNIFHCEGRMAITMIYTDDFQLTKSGKRKFVIQNIIE